MARFRILMAIHREESGDATPLSDPPDPAKDQDMLAQLKSD